CGGATRKARSPCWGRPGHWARSGPTVWFVVKSMWTRIRSVSSPSDARSRPVSLRSSKWTIGCPTAASRTDHPLRHVLALVSIRALFVRDLLALPLSSINHIRQRSQAFTTFAQKLPLRPSPLTPFQRPDPGWWGSHSCLPWPGRPECPPHHNHELGAVRPG